MKPTKDIAEQKLFELTALAGLTAPISYRSVLSMLQTCAPGMAVVTIQNGIGAGAIAVLITNRAAAARLEGSQVKEE